MIWTDTLQLSVLLSGLAGAVWVIVQRVDGGVSGILSAAEATGKLRFFDFSAGLTGEVTFWGGLIGGGFLMLGQYGVDQAELQRFLTTSSIRKSRMAVVSSMAAGVMLGFLLFFIGTALHVFYSQRPDLGSLLTTPDRAFPKFIIEELPAGLKGLVVAGVFAASMSTISSVLNSLATVSVSDVYQRLTGRQVSVPGARWMTLGFGLIGTAVALNAERFGTILVATSKLTNFFGGTLIGTFMLVKRANGNGAFLGAVCGFVSVLLVSSLTDVSWMWYGVFAAMVSFGTGAVLSSCFDSPLPKDGLVWRRRW